MGAASSIESYSLLAVQFKCIWKTLCQLLIANGILISSVFRSVYVWTCKLNNYQRMYIMVVFVEG